MAEPHLQVMASKSGDGAKRAAIYLALLAVPAFFLAFFFAWPVVAMAWRGLGGGSWDARGAWEVLSRPRTLRVLWFTVWMATVATASSVLLGLPAAFILYRRRCWGFGGLRALILVPFVLPTVVVGVAFRSIFAAGGPLASLGWDGTWQPILLAMIFFNVSVVVRSVGPMWATLDPRTAESAAALGASPREVFRTVTWPALRPAILGAAVVVFLFCSTAFGIVLMLGGLRYGTLETEIYSLTVDFLDLRAAAVLSITQFVLVAVLLVGAERARSGAASNISGVRRGFGASIDAPRLSRRDLPAVSVLAGIVLLIAAPLLTLIVRSLHSEGHWSLSHYRHLGGVGAALATSWSIAIDATVLAMMLGLCVSICVAWRPRTARARRGIALVDAAFMLPLGMSAVTVGFGFLLTLDRPPFDLASSPILIPIAQAVVALPLVVRTLVPALRSVDARPREAAAALGASPVRAWLTADLPVLWRPLVAATGFALTVSLGEFGATAFLAQPQRPTLPVYMYTLLSHPGEANFGAALAAAVILGSVTTAVVFIMEKVGGSAAGRM